VKRIVIAGVLAVAAAGVLGAGTASARQQTTTVGVKASEFKFVLTKQSVPKGTVVFKVTNVGHIAHDFSILGKKIPLLQPGKSASLTVKFAKAGRYPYKCTVPGHAQAGMKGVLTVK
jgi:uncharacterized cupredoxin-like copper-binding protein